MVSRLDKWKEPKNLGFGIVVNDEKKADQITELRKKINPQPDNEGGKVTINELISTCRELIFDIKDGEPTFHSVSYVINSDTLDIEATLLFEILVSDEPGDDEGEGLRNILAIAVMEEVPVYPNTPDLAARLAAEHRRMLVEGFTAPDGKGDRVRLRLARRPTKEFDDPDFLTRIDCTSSIYPAEVELLRKLALEQFGRLARAEQVLNALDLAVAELSECMNAVKRNESALQECITAHPILFGTDYIGLRPKHKLGAEYEMDYALERLSGQFDLVELESSTLPLYTKSGNPSSHLVHAEQQVLDWIHWLEKNNSYAQANLPGVFSPVAYVVIGARADLDAENAEKLRRRNATWRGQLQIMTYDDLMDRARNLRNHLIGLAS